MGAGSGEKNPSMEFNLQIYIEFDSLLYQLSLVHATIVSLNLLSSTRKIVSLSPRRYNNILPTFIRNNKC